MTVQIGLPSVRRKERRLPTRVGRGYYLRTFGCQMNENDSERIAALLESDGMARVDHVEQADVIVLNTCCVRENADNKLYGNLGHLKPLKDRNPYLRLMVGGCLAQKDRGLVQEKAPWVDVVFGTHNIHRVVELLDYADQWGGITEITEETETAPWLLPARRDLPYSAWVTIQIGCDNSCTFCIVPHVRGKEVSRRPGDIVREVRDLVADGVVEVTLLGQNVNSYGRDLALEGRRRPIFAELLRRVGAVEGIRRLRYTSPHPKDFREEVAQAMAETEAVCEQLHLPLQSGSDRILARMHRGYNAERYLGKLEMARRYVAGLAVSTDIIVGFPGETEQDFQDTLEVVGEADFDSAYTFIYSPRPGTPAAEMDEQLPTEVVQERFARLVALQERISLERNRRLVGERLEVLAEGPSKKDARVATTRTRTNKVVHVPGQFPVGRFLDVEVVKAAPHHLLGRVA
ncbi:MAG: tRNA (N6-isopentenyl adenosine(37)-C2)-methylthiotransferase MiaB [Actinomycetota bacterium]|nr:tRNA (N6-isopentenyl adenosine(37)-C2)-methylthiotransferase MiaB [Actinomycetota bacterium]